MNPRKIKLIFAAWLCALNGFPCFPQDQADWKWVNDHFPSVLAERMPIKERLGSSFGYRSHRDLHTQELESSFVIHKIPRERYLKAVVRTPDTVSLYDQIMNLHRKDPEESLESIKKQLKVKERHLSEQTCPVVRIQYEQFLALTLPVFSDKERAAEAQGIRMITLHPRIHTIRADLPAGKLELILTEDDHEFVKWAKKTLGALDTCLLEEVSNSKK